jgi:hypothetical protein
MATKGPATKISTRLDRIESRPIPWLWERRVPLGSLSVLYGQPKIGKGAICGWIASMVTRGELPGEFYGDPSHVGLAWSEDPDASTRLSPYFEISGGNPKLAHAIHPFTITEEYVIDRLQGEIEKRDIVFLVIDQLLDFLHPDLADKLGTDAVRQPLALLNQLANDTGVAIMVVLHESDKARTKKIMNSTAFTAVPRVILRVGGRPSLRSDTGFKPESRELRVVSSNLPGVTREPLRYETTKITRDIDGKEVEVIEVIWLDQIEAPSVAAPELNGQGQEEQAAVFLKGFLKRGSREVPDIVDRAEKKGLSKSALDRASRRIGVIKTRTGVGSEHVGVWALK